MFMCKWYIYLFTHAANRFKSHVNKPSTNIVCALVVYNIYICWDLEGSIREKKLNAVDEMLVIDYYH